MNDTMWAVRLLETTNAYLPVLLKFTNSNIVLNICSYHARSCSTILRTGFQGPCNHDQWSVVSVNKEKTFIGGLKLRLDLRCGETNHSKMQLRLKHGRGKKSRSSQDDESDSDDEEDDDDSSGFGNHYEEDENLPNNCAEIKKNVKSLRIDSIVSAGLNISRNKVDEYFLSSKLLLNGEKVLKKSKQMSEGDAVDLISEVIAEEDDKMKVKRVRVVKLDENKTSKGKMIVYLRCWRGNVLVDKVAKWSPRSRNDDLDR